MGDWKNLMPESQARWETIAEFWDDYMGEESNRFHRELIRPKTEELLAVAEGQTILDIGCGNGNFSRRLAELGARVVAVDLHPCFQPPGLRKIHETEETGGTIVTRSSVQISKYLTPEPFESIGIRGQPVPHLVFHRPLAWYMNLFFGAGFVLDGFAEPHYEPSAEGGGRFDWMEIPPAAIFRFRKVRRPDGDMGG